MNTTPLSVLGLALTLVVTATASSTAQEAARPIVAELPAVSTGSPWSAAPTSHTAGLEMPWSVAPAADTTALAAPRWHMSKESNTGYRDVFTGRWTPLTGERVGYWGAPRAGFPKVGQLYYGGIEVFNYGNPTNATGATTFNPEVRLPKDTRPAVDATRPKRMVRCYWFHPADDTSGEFTHGRFKGNDCPDRVSGGGTHGRRLLPSTRNGTWRIPAGYGISITFPIISRSPLRGYAGVPRPHCIVGSVWAAGGGTPDGRVWDAPRAGQQCPLPQYHGTDRPVVVRRRT